VPFDGGPQPALPDLQRRDRGRWRISPPFAKD